MFGLKDRRIQKVLDILENNPFCSINELAESVNLSRSRLEHLFKDQIGMQMGDYLLECRLKTAAELLKSSDMSVKEIAHLAGYEHSSSFIRAFKNMFGTIPSDYRQSLAEMASE
jgi:transcriptional regulator GlxA family with amidase domain